MSCVLAGLFFIALKLPFGESLAGVWTGLIVGLRVGFGVPLMMALIYASPVLIILGIVVIYRRLNRQV
jgi:hypothetical protein